MSIKKPVYSIRISKRVSEEKDAFKQLWPLIKAFVVQLFEMEGTNHRQTNKIEEAIMELCYKGFEKEINHELNLIFYELFHDFLIRVSTLQAQQMVEQLLRFYKHLSQILVLLAELLQYWEVLYLSKKQDKTLRRVVLNILHNQICNQHLVEELITQSVLKWIEDYRQQAVATNGGEELTKITIDIGMFKKSIEAEMLERTKNYYQAKRNRMPNNIEFLSLIDRQLKKESYLMRLMSVSEDTTKIIQKEFICENLDEIVNFLDYLINHEQRPQLQLLWNFLSMVDHVDLLERRLEQLINDTQKLLLSGKIQQVLKYKLSLQKIVTECFGNKKQQLQFINNIFQGLFSQHFSICNESMAEYIIENYRSRMVAEDVDSLALQMFKISPSTDLLVLLYQDKLAKQALTSNNPNLARHLQLMANVKLYAGHGLITPIEKMLDDVWRDGQLVQYCAGKFKCKLVFKNNWPKFDGTQLNIPDAMRQIRSEFEEKYLEQHSYKQLIWVYNLGNCVMTIDGVTHNFSELQASIVIYISKAIRPMRVQQLITVLKIDAKQVRECVQQLLENQIIIKDSHSKVFEVNYDNKKEFSRKIKYPVTQFDKLSINIDRDTTTQACITRLLKRRKIMPRTAVVKEVIDMIKHFRPTLEQINNSIKKLISIEYIKINGNDLHYLA